MRTVQEMIMGRWKNKGVLSRKDSNVMRERQTEGERQRQRETAWCTRGTENDLTARRGRRR